MSVLDHENRTAIQWAQDKGFAACALLLSSHYGDPGQVLDDSFSAALHVSNLEKFED